MTRDDLYGYYRRYYVPNNATLVVVGDVDTDDVLRRVEKPLRHASSRATLPPRQRTVEPPQLGERRVRIDREGTTAYLKLAYHAPAAADPGLLPAARARRGADRRQGREPLVLFRNPPQRSARLYRALVEGGSPRRSSARLLPTEHPFLYTISITATDGVPLEVVEEAAMGSWSTFVATASRRRSSSAQGTSSGHGSCSKLTA